ncbi:helicase-related protein [Paraburkholderia tropica]|uniref:helicase-related protein n=1 Tax=Paraburkholderia tropica TaxID=92647 RepID=UPI003D2BC725
MNSRDFDKIIRSKAPRPAFQEGWARQRATAREFLSRFNRGFDTQLLADEVGMGKTYVAMALIVAMLRNENAGQRRALLVTPPSAVLRAKWEQELRSFGDTYLRNDEGHVAPLRPLIVSDYWQLVANLHDYNDDPVGRVSALRQGSVLDTFWTWCKSHRLLQHPKTPCRASEEFAFDRNSEEALSFTSGISLSGWFAFLDELRAGQEPLVREMARQFQTQDYRGALFWLNGVFRNFTAVQSRYVPDVLILGMSGLRRPNLNQWETQRFCTFLLAVLLCGTWEGTRNNFITLLSDDNLIVAGMDSKKLKKLERADLYKTRDCVEHVMNSDEQLRARWAALRADPEAKRIRPFFKDLMDAVIRAKIAESGIALAVIDEAHNWKDGNNGGNEFETVFAPSIDHKLLMSATPFQLAEGEMQRVFDRAVRPEGKTQAALNAIYGAGGVVTECIAANDRFRKRWDDLAGDAGAQAILHEMASGVSPAELGARIEALANDRLADARVQALCVEALSYRSAIDRLGDAQRSIVIRHTKPRTHRAFHVGHDFMRPEVQPQRTALYEAHGMAEAGDAFIHYLAMRLDQRIRVGGGALDTANAHLMRGLTSSKSAFRASSTAIKALPAHVDPVTRDYITMFDAVLDHHEHPKVRATVGRALANYRNGRKTLIFCERVDTLKEIETALRDGIDKSSARHMSGNAERRKTLLEQAEFVDMRLARLWWMSLSGREANAFAAASRIRHNALQFAVDTLSRIGAKVTSRRVHRLMDLWAIAEIPGHTAVATAARTLLTSLRDGLTREPLPDAGLVHSILVTDIESGTDAELVRKEAEPHAESWFSDITNIWESANGATLSTLVWQLLESEAGTLLQRDSKPEEVARSFYDTYIALQRGLRKVILRPDLFGAYVEREQMSGRPVAGTKELADAVCRGIHAPRGEGESPWIRMERFVRALVDANGSINPHASTNTQRRSLWRGVNIQPTRHGANDEEADARTGEDDFAVQTLYGEVKADRRVVLCAAFNSPLAPDILVCTAIGSEGIDLHKECVEVIHHDLPWNPAKLEQRIGRIDRVGSLAETSGQQVRIGIPFQEHSYERYQYSVLLARAQRFQVLLGKPDFDIHAIDEEATGTDEDEVKELLPDLDMTNDEPHPPLPEGLLQWLSVDLSLRRAGAGH